MKLPYSQGIPLTYFWKRGKVADTGRTCAHRAAQGDVTAGSGTPWPCRCRSPRPFVALRDKGFAVLRVPAVVNVAWGLLAVRACWGCAAEVAWRVWACVRAAIGAGSMDRWTSAGRRAMWGRAGGAYKFRCTYEHMRSGRGWPRAAGQSIQIGEVSQFRRNRPNLPLGRAAKEVEAVAGRGGDDVRIGPVSDLPDVLVVDDSSVGVGVRGRGCVVGVAVGVAVDTPQNGSPSSSKSWRLSPLLVRRVRLC